MGLHRSRTLRRHPSLLHPSFRRAPREGTAGLQTPASGEPVQERGDQVFWERTRVTAGSDDFANDNFFPDLGNLFINDMADNTNAGGSVPAAPYVTLSLLFEIILDFLFLVCALDAICSSTVLVCMISSISVSVVMIYFLLIRIKNRGNLLIFSTIQKPDYRQFTPSGFAAHLKPPTFKWVQYKRWRTRAVYWFQTMCCYDATKGKPEGDLNPAQLEAFEKIDTLFKGALLSVLDDSIVDSYMSFDNGKDMWDALEAKFGASDAGSELYVMEQLYDYKMTDERTVVQQAHEIQSLATDLEYFKCVLPDKFIAGGIIAKLPPSWNNFATSLKHKRQEFSVSDLISTLDVEEKARAKDTRARVAEGASR